MKKKVFSVYIGFITFLMLSFVFACEKLYKYENFVWNGQNTFSILAVPFCCGILAALVCYFFIKKSKECKNHTKIPDITLSTWKMFLISFLFMVISWIPAFLAYYPGICAYDFQPQMYQIFYDAYNDHHPLIHTLMIELFWNLGNKIFHSATTGIACFTICQILLVSATFSFVVVALRNHFQNQRLGWILMILFGWYPFHFYLSISITKDIPFSMGMLLAVTALFILLSGKNNRFKPEKWDIALLLGLMIVMLFRNNGKYGIFIYLFVSAVMIPFVKGRRKLLTRIATESAIACVVGMICLSLLGTYTNATGGDKREMLSLPGQQIARVVHYHADELPEETLTTIETVIWPSALYCYRPDIADPVKKDIISYEVLTFPKKYAELYINLLVNYPSEYINAFLGLYAGFLNPLDVTSNYINDEGEGVAEGLYYIQTVFYDEDMTKFDLEQKPVLPFLHTWMESFANSTVYQKIPLLNLIMVPGVFLWAYLYLLGFSIYKHKTKYLVPLGLIAGYFLTLFAGPTVQLRYLYPVMLCVPVVICFIFCKVKKEHK